MKAVFAHDHVFVTWQGEVYSPGQLPYKSWARYLEHFSTLTVVARARPARDADEVHALSRSDGPGVGFAMQSRRGPAWPFSAARQTDAIGAAIRGADVVIARIPSRIGVQVARLARQLDRPLGVEVVGSARHSLWYHGTLSAKLYAPILDLQTKLAARHSRFALYVTRSYLQARYPCPGFTRNASNVAIARVDRRLLEQRRQRMSTRSGPLVIGFVGTLIADYKGLDTLLRSIARLRAAGLPCLLKVVGEGDPSRWHAMAQSLGVHDSVEFLGTLPGTEAVRDWMQRIDVFALPSKTEGLPRALIEAMSCGCLSFATDVGGVPELLEPRHMFRPGDSARLAQLLRAAAEDRNMLADAVFSNAAVADRYTADVLDEVRRGFFRELAQQASGGAARSGVVAPLVAERRLHS